MLAVALKVTERYPRHSEAGVMVTHHGEVKPVGLRRSHRRLRVLPAHPQDLCHPPAFRFGHSVCSSPLLSEVPHPVLAGPAASCWILF